MIVGNNRMQHQESTEIRDVWQSNLEDEFTAIREVVIKFPYIAMDTEFPGVVARPVGEFRSMPEYNFQVLRINVDILKMIQLGLTFFDADGKRPHPVCTWQFNFKFDLNNEMFADDSIDLLQRSGINFQRHEQEGIEHMQFAELLMTSGLVLTDDTYWITFHSGYDFGYLLKILSCLPIPDNERDFFEVLRIYFPVFYDIKFLMKSCKTLKGGLQEVADELGVHRIGPQHQAGSDSMLTGQAFFKMRSLFFEGIIDNERYNGMLYGYGANY
eukprot:m.336707 g.336707  ORF g.336707 m.336707 type:complete len:271 (+) comp17938_c0_seq1:202-1014(+)